MGSESSASGWRIQVAGSGGAVLKDVCEGLLYYGYEVSAISASVREALGAAEERRPNLVVLVLGLGGREGADWLEAAGIIQNIYGIPVVIYDFDEEARISGRILDLEPVVCLKGRVVERERLRVAVEVALARQRGGRRLRKAAETEGRSTIMDYCVSDDAALGGGGAERCAGSTGGRERVGRRSFVPLCALRKQAFGGSEVDAKIQQHREAVLSRGVCLDCLAALSTDRR